jgi:methanogenic corrinoid protein MtbC1
MTTAEPTYGIKQVADLTGLTAERLRAWERRYAVVRPVRRANGYRTYTTRQVALLRVFAQLIEDGARIGDLIDEPMGRITTRAARRRSDHPVVGPLLDAIRILDRRALETLVAQELSRRGIAGFAEEVALPLAQIVGDEWALGTVSIAAEHLASEVVVHALKGALNGGDADAPTIVAACGPGDRHEWGILAALARARAQGWRIHYLGPDLPVAQAVEACWRLRPDVLAIAVSDAGLCAAARPELVRGLRALPDGTIALVAGAGAAAHGRDLRRAGFRVGDRSYHQLLRTGRTR